MVAKHPKPIRSRHTKLNLEREKAIEKQAKLKEKQPNQLYKHKSKS